MLGSRFGLPAGFLLLFVVAFGASGLGTAQRSPAVGTPSPSPAASPSPAFNVVPATPEASQSRDEPRGALGRTDSDGGQSAQPIRPSGRISIDGGPLRGTKIRRPTLATRSVYDPYRLLDADQRNTLRGDTERLRRAGIPTLVYIRISEANDIQAAAFADRLLDEWNVESAPGANDGVVILISMGVTTRRTGEVMIRTGPRALPQGGLDETRLANITEERIAPRVERGQIYTGALTGLRGMIYTIFYFPAPQAPPSGWQQRVAGILTWLAPTLGAVALFGTLGRWLRRPRFLGSTRLVGRVVPAFVLTCCLLLALLSVYARSRLGVAVVVLMVLILALTSLIRTWRTTARRSWPGRSIAVGPWHWRGQAPEPLAASPVAAVSSRRAMATRRVRRRRRGGEQDG
jgi:uncharacterized membrane protein YgcG